MKQTGVCFCSAAKSNNTFTPDLDSESMLVRKPASRSRCKLHTTWLTREAHAVGKKKRSQRGAFPLSDVMGKRCTLMSFLPLFLTLPIAPPVLPSSVRSCWQLCTVASFCSSSPHPGPEHVPPIRSRQRNAWKSLNALPLLKSLFHCPREDAGGTTRQPSPLYFIGLCPSNFPNNLRLYIENKTAKE